MPNHPSKNNKISGKSFHKKDDALKKSMKKLALLRIISGTSTSPKEKSRTLNGAVKRITSKAKRGPKISAMSKQQEFVDRTPGDRTERLARKTKFMDSLNSLSGMKKIANKGRAIKDARRFRVQQ